MKKFRLLRTVSITISLLILAAVIFIFIIINLALTDSYTEKYAQAPYDDTLVATAIKSAISGKKFFLTDDQINTYLNQKFIMQNKDDGTGIEKLRVYNHKNFTEVYAKIKYLGYSTGAFCKIKMEYNIGTRIITAEIYDVYLGELAIPEHIFKKLLPELIHSDKIQINENTLSITASKDYQLDEYSMNLHAASFLPDEGGISCKTNSLTSETLTILRKYCLSEKGRQKFKEVFSIDIDQIKDMILEKINDTIDNITDSIKDKIKSQIEKRNQT